MNSRWIIFIIIAGAAWQIVSAIIQQAAKKREQEKLQEAARANQSGGTGTQQGTPQPIRMDKPSPVGKTHAQTLAERRRAQLEELRARRSGRSTQPPPRSPTSPPRQAPLQARTSTPPRSSGPQPIPLPTQGRRQVGPKAEQLTSRPTGASSKPSKAIRTIKPGLAAAQAALVSHSDLERKARDAQKQRDRQAAQLQQQVRERAEREQVAKARSRSTREKARDKARATARKQAHEAEHEGQSVAHRLVRDTVTTSDPYGLQAVAKASDIRVMLSSPAAARNAIVLTELLGLPVSMRVG